MWYITYGVHQNLIGYLQYVSGDQPIFKILVHLSCYLIAVEDIDNKL